MDPARFEPAAPLPVADGIAASSLDGEPGDNWWSRRFIELLESFGVGSRLERGRDYARSGQVTELEVEPGIVLAKVQGTRYTPYRVRIRAKPLSEHQWRRAERAMAAEALLLAQLLARQMPQDIEALLAACKLSLFPAAYEDLKAGCDCPDAANPCKHIAAVYYLLAERFADDPFLIFTWRGRTEEELLDGLRARRARGRRTGQTVADAPGAGSAAAPDPAPISFWHSGPELADLRISPLAGEAPDALLRQLGPAPVTSGGRDVAELLKPVYERLAAAAERRALAE